MSSPVGAQFSAPADEAQKPASANQNQSYPPELEAAFARIHEFILQRLASGAQRGPGFAIAVTDRAGLLFSGSYGYANLEAKQPVTAETRFEVGSIGKSFVALALLQQQEQGRLDLHAPITQYLPWFSIKSDFAPITVHDVLCHSAGLPMGMNYTPSAPREEVYALRELQTGFAPGTQFWYSNLGYMLLGLVLERVSGQSYAAALQQGILDRIGMRDSEPIISQDTRTRLATCYLPLYDDRPWHDSQPLYQAPWIEYSAGDGSVACTVADLATYLRMLLNRGKGVVSADSFKLMTTPLISSDEDGEYYGYGINTSQNELLDNHTIINHGGEMVGYHASIRADMDDGIGVAAFNNGPIDTGEEVRFALQVLHAALHGKPLPELPPASEAAPVENPADYVGTYRSSKGTLEVVAVGGGLAIVRENENIALEHRWGEAFYTPHRDFAGYNFLFGRAANGKVQELFHGPNWYVNDAYAGASEFAYPDAWNAYVGHYRSHNPWMHDFRIFLRKGVLQSISFGTWRRPLVPLADGSFRLGEEEYSPERVRFSAIVEGEAIRATVSGAEYYRVDTPLAALTISRTVRYNAIHNNTEATMEKQ